MTKVRPAAVKDSKAVRGAARDRNERKPAVVLNHYAYPEAVDLLSSVCDVTAVRARSSSARTQLELHVRQAHALMVVTPECIDEALLRECRNLKIIACAFRTVDNIDIAACTHRGIWVTNAIARSSGSEAELEAARNILDVLSGDPPRGALNEVLPRAA